MLQQFINALVNRIKSNKIFRFTIIILVGLLIVSFISRTIILKMVIKNISSKIDTRYNAYLAITDADFSGLFTIHLNRISLCSKNSDDTLVKIKDLFISMRILPLLLAKLKPESLLIDSLTINFIKKDSIDNFRFLLRKKQTADNENDSEQVMNYAERFNIFLEAIFNKIPEHFRLTNFNLSVTDSAYFAMHIKQFEIINHTFKTNIKIDESPANAGIMLEGKIDPSNKMAGIKIYSPDTSKVRIPFVLNKWNLRFAFDTLQFHLTNTSLADNILSLDGFSSVNDLVLNQPKISTSDVTMNFGEINYHVKIGEDYYELDSSTNVTYNKLTFNPYIKLRPKPTPQLELRIHKNWFTSQDLFESLPGGLFNNLQGIQTNGELAFYFDFSVDTSVPDSLEFNADLKRKQFRIVHYGAGNLAKMNDNFEYTAYEKDVPVKTWTIGYPDPSFISLDKIPLQLQYSVMTSEDGGFFQHRGFYIDAFKESIATDIKQKRFARGGSTISMQLVKNVFLKRNKTVARKLEEMLIVWLIENNAITTKERMFEVYLNIIEWAPGIYGINDAAKFYFNKKPAQLTLSECIFLTSLIPRPKGFKYQFENGHLRAHLADYYRLVSNKMLRKGWISERDTVKLIPDVELKGPALQFLKKDVMQVDTTNESPFIFE